MKPLALALLLAAAGCGKADAPAARRSNATGEPNRIHVQHVLIAFQGSERADAKVTRSQEEAEVMAQEILARARRGEDFEKLMKDHSNDPGKGSYRLVNHGSVGESGDKKRKDFVPGFGDVAFKLKVGEIGLAPYDKARTPHGYHIIKRVE